MFSDESLKLRTDLPFPYNLVEAIQENLPEDMEITGRGIVRMIDDKLTPRESEIIKMRWRDKMSFDAIAKVYGVTRERIRQIEAKALRKLNGSRNSLIEYTVAPFAEYLREKTLRETAEQRLDYFLQHADYSVKLKEEIEGDPTEDIPLKGLDLSVRSYNVLRRYGCETLFDVTDIETEDKFLKMRNLGKKSAEEIIEKVHSFGKKMKWEEM